MDPGVIRLIHYAGEPADASWVTPTKDDWCP